MLSYKIRPWFQNLPVAVNVASWGGDEFIVFLHHMHGESVAAYIQEIQCGGIERISVNGETKVMSIGYAMYPEDGTNLEALTRKTDKAMYNAKNLKLAT